MRAPHVSQVERGPVRLRRPADLRRKGIRGQLVRRRMFGTSDVLGPVKPVSNYVCNK